MSRVRRYFTETVTLAPGESVVRSIRTAFVTCLDATGAFKIAIDDEGFSEFGQGLTLTLDTPSRQVWLQNASGDNNTVQLAYGEGGVRDQRLNVSAPIDIIDPFSRALNDQQVFVIDTTSSPAASQYAHVELANPAGSGKLLTVTGLRIAVDVADFVALDVGSDASPLADVKTPVSTRIKAGGAVTNSAARSRRESRGTQQTPANRTGLSQFYLTQHAPLNLKISFVLEPNVTVRAYTGTVDTQLELGVQWIEEPFA